MASEHSCESQGEAAAASESNEPPFSVPGIATRFRQWSPCVRGSCLSGGRPLTQLEFADTLWNPRIPYP